MSTRSPFADPLAGALGAVAGVGSFLLIPGAAVAIPAALGIGALVYGAKVAVNAMRGDGEPRQPAGAGAVSSSDVPKRGSPAEVWVGRGQKALDSLRQQASAADGEVLRGQLENVVLETSGSGDVLRALAGQVAAVERGMERIPLDRLAADRRRLGDTITRPDLTDTARDETRQALGEVDEQGRAYDRLAGTRRELLARMERIVLGLEGLRSHLAEVVAVSQTALTVDDAGGEQRIAEINDELTALRAGLEESRAYTDRVLRGEPS